MRVSIGLDRYDHLFSISSLLRSCPDETGSWRDKCLREVQDLL